MTKQEAKNIISQPCKQAVLVALSYVNLGDEELDVLMFRFMRQHTQEEAAEKFDCSVNHVYDVEKRALEKCAEVWDGLVFVKKVLEK